MIGQGSITNLAAFQGWGEPFEGERWSQCTQSEIYFHLGWLPNDKSQAVLTLSARANGPQAIELFVNGQPIGTLYRTDEQQTTTHFFPATLLRPQALNTLTFHFPDAHYPNQWDQRPLGMAFTRLVLEMKP
jgi:hypothetical protein